MSAKKTMRKRNRRSVALDDSDEDDDTTGSASGTATGFLTPTTVASSGTVEKVTDLPVPMVEAEPKKQRTPPQPAVLPESSRTSSSIQQSSIQQKRPPQVLASPAKKGRTPTTPPKNDNVTSDSTPTKERNVRRMDSRAQLRMSGNTIGIFVLSDKVSFVQQTGQITKLWTVVLPSGEHASLHLEDAAHDRADLYDSLTPFAYVELQGVASKKTPEHNCVFLRMTTGERRLYFNSKLTSDSITDLDARHHFKVPPMGPYNTLTEETRGDNCLHETLAFAVTNASKSVNFDRHHRTSTRQMELMFEDGMKMDAIFYGHHAKREWKFAGRFDLVFVLHAKQEGGRIIVNESSVLSSSAPYWFTGDVADFDEVREIPAGGIEEMVDMVEVYSDPERGAGFIANLTEKSSLVQPKLRIEGDVVSVDERMPTLCNGNNGNYLAFKIKVSQVAPKEAEVVAFGKQAEDLANTSLKDYMRMSEEDKEEVVAKIRQATVRITASAEWYPPTSSYQFKAKTIELL